MEIRGDSPILQEVRDVPWAYVALPRRQWAGFSRRLPKAIAGVAFVEAAAALGATQKYNDFNGVIQEAGAGFYQSTKTTDGVRASTASAFIRPILGPRTSSCCPRCGQRDWCSRKHTSEGSSIQALKACRLLGLSAKWHYAAARSRHRS